MKSNNRAFASLAVVFLLGVSMLLGACSARHQGGKDSVGFTTSRNEGAPLTPTEKTVLHESGQIDKNIPRAEMEDVTAEYHHFLRTGRPVMERFSQRAAQYLPWAQKVFRDRGMPEDLACLAIIESGYRADIKSKAGAAGAWQFMPATGKSFDLSQDAWNDERLDPYEATEAAARYLQKLYADFRDWPTAVAAYNAGEGKIKRAKEGTGGRNFYEVKQRNDRLSDKARLREETLRYVPRFLAVTKIMRNLEKLGFPAVQPELSPEILRYTVKPNTDLRGMARAVNLPWSEFSQYNRHHKQATSAPHRETYVYVPATCQTQATAFLLSPNAVAKSGKKFQTVQVATAQKGNGKTGMATKRGKRATYTVQARDSLWVIARKHNVSVDDLKRWNKIDESKLIVGKVLVVSGI